MRVVSALVLLIWVACYTKACNDILCGPIVTKCQLLKYCNCEMPDKENPKDCDCCADCAACLEDKYPSCCSCVGKKSNQKVYALVDTREVCAWVVGALASSAEGPGIKTACAQDLSESSLIREWVPSSLIREWVPSSLIREWVPSSLIREWVPSSLRS